ncbi:hypothetical protein B4U80_01676 [Leptotrombidium deliense]|uniref:Chitin-binding type-2 domain-containing protein n=1 Tax=Leptotrombidium deliense TaxID=299467 RepID=A0A443SVI7_9ACAR|nr:hypothetical protein B4U80_01676 [Leptotrombidium deliense]
MGRQTGSVIVGHCQRTSPQFQFQPQPQSNFQSQPQSSPQSSPPRYEQPAPSSASRPPSPQSQPATNFNCPESFGFFPHHKSCDKYYSCDNGTATLKLCGNGLVFAEDDSQRENCAYPFSVDCGERTDLEPPISTPNCPRLYGIFPHPSNCRIFYSCWNGEASKYECPPGLAYDAEQRVCVWADLVDRCDQLEVAEGFVCPDPTEVDQPGHYTRHAHPTDCRKFYVCIDSTARPYGCSFGTVFNVDTLQCDDPENVPGCEKYYGEIDSKTVKKLQGRN